MEFQKGKELIEYFMDQGIQLWTEEGKLRYKAPLSSLSEETLQILKDNKAILVDYMTASEEEQVKSDPESKYDPFPMTDIQTAYVLGRKDTFQYGGVACHVYLELLYESLEEERVQAAWQTLIERHDMLHAVMYENGYQAILEDIPKIRVNCYDMRDDEEKLVRLREDMGHRMYPLGNWPMFEIAVSKHSHEDILHFSMEFLLADWVSIWSLFAEFEKIYFNKEEVNPEIRVTFRDCVLGEKRIKNGDSYLRDRKYWLEQLERFPSAPQLPLKRNLSESIRPKFERYMLRLNPDRWNSLKANAQVVGVTPTVSVLTAYADALARWSLNRDFCINMTVLNRMPIFKDINRVVGDFTSLNLLPVYYNREDNFVQRAKNINSRLFNDLDHRLYSGVEMIRELVKIHGRELSLMPIVFTSAIGLVDSNNQLIGQFGDYGITQTPQVFIDCQAMDGYFGLQVNWDVRKGIFPDGLISDLFCAFEQQLNLLAEQCENWKNPLHVSLPDWQKSEREHANATEALLPNGVLHEKFLEMVKKYPKHTAVADAHGELSYEELDQLARQVAEEIIRSGGRQQDNIAVIMEKCRYQAAGVLGVLYMGGVYVPIDAKQAQIRRNKILENVKSEIILTTSDLKTAFDEKLSVIEVDQLNLSETDFVPRLTGASKPAYIIYTSGSTGEPKGVVISHAAARNTIEDINARYQIGHNDAVFGISQLNFDLSVYDLFGLLSAGGTVVYPDAARYMDPEHWSELIKKYRVSIWNSVPALMQMFLTYLKSYQEEDIPLRIALLSGDWIPLELPEQLLKEIPELRLVSLGGATEASIWSNYHEYQEVQKDWVSIPYGRPLSNQKYYILDAEFQDCPVWKAGALYIAGSGLAECYFGDSELTDEKFVRHPHTGERIYCTGDMARYLPGGEIEFLGRKDTQIKIRGNRIELGEIEHVLSHAPSVQSAVACVNQNKNEILALAEIRQDGNYDKKKSSEDFLMLTKDIEISAIKENQELYGKNFDKALQSRNTAAAYAMCRAIEESGYFATDALEHIDEKYHWIVRHWAAHLQKQGYFNQQADGLRDGLDISRNAVAEKWSEAYRAWDTALGSKDIIDYIKLNADNLTEILSGKADPVGFLYSNGEDRFVEALYINNSMAAYLNRCIEETLRKIVSKASGRKLRVLEIGAGSGATTEYVLRALEGAEFEYYFTDVTKYFFPAAKERFINPNIKFCLLDIDDDMKMQGFASNYFDIIVGAYVMNNAKDIKKSLKQIEELIAPKGYFLFSEPVQEETWLLASQALMMNQPQDDLRNKSLFSSVEDWIRLLGEDSPVKVVPKDGSELQKLSVSLFIKQYKTDQCIVDENELKSYLSLHLPEYMMPSHIIFTNRFPLTSNGKVDRKQALKWAEVFTNSHEADVGEDASMQLENKLEEQVAQIWKGQLNIDKIGKNQNFYDFGADSLIMAQAATKIRNVLKLDIPFDSILRQMLNYPRVKDTAQFISHEKKKDKSEVDEKEDFNDNHSFAYIQNCGRDSGEQRTRILIHGVLGSVDIFRHLGPALAEQKQGNVFAIGIADIEQYCKLQADEAVEFLADQYTELLCDMKVKHVQIIGYSFSGVVAVELAKRLLERGIEVDDVSIVDGGTMPIQLQEELLYELLFLDNIHVTLKDLGFGSQALLEKAFMQIEQSKNKTLALVDMNLSDGDRERIEELRLASQPDRFELYAQISRENSGMLIEPKVMTTLFHTFKQSFQALQFVPEAYFGDIHYYASKDRRGVFQHLDMLLDYWENVCLGEFSRTEIDGNHYTCLENKENAIRLASMLKEALLNA